MKLSRPTNDQLAIPTGASLDLPNSFVDLQERDQSQPGELPRVVPTELRQPVVVRSKNCGLEWPIREPKQSEAQRGIEDLRRHPVNRHVLEALGRIPASGACGLIPNLLKRRQFFGGFPRREGACDGARFQALADEPVS